MKILLLFLFFGKMNIVIDINQSSLCERVVNHFVVRTIEVNTRTPIIDVCFSYKQRKFIIFDYYVFFSLFGGEFFDFNHRPRRQEFNGNLVENGPFYICFREDLLESKCRISGKIGCYVMSEKTYYEIDEPDDWTIIESIINSRNKSL